MNWELKQHFAPDSRAATKIRNACKEIISMQEPSGLSNGRKWNIIDLPEELNVIIKRYTGSKSMQKIYRVKIDQGMIIIEQIDYEGQRKDFLTLYKEEEKNNPISKETP